MLKRSKQITLDKRCTIDTKLYADHNNEEELPDCDLCLALMGQLGDQKIKCDCKEKSEHAFALTDAQLGDMEGQLIDCDNDAPALKDAKSKAKEALPKSAFSRKVRVHYIRAGPGCGKSFIIRKLADENDLVLAPFSKLRPDYKSLVNKNGTTYDLTFKTQHRGMLTKGIPRIFVDEFSSFPYEYPACIVNNNAATEVFLVGDEKQTRIQEPAEGMYIGNRIDLTWVSTHNYWSISETRPIQ